MKDEIFALIMHKCGHRLIDDPPEDWKVKVYDWLMANRKEELAACNAYSDGWRYFLQALLHLSLLDPEDASILRDVDLDGYRVQTWDTEGPLNERCRIAYRLTSPTGEVLFDNDDFSCSTIHSIDGDECLRGIMSFLTLRPGDVEKEYFDNYTPAQLAFSEGDAEDLALWGLDDENGELSYKDWKDE